MLRVAPPIELTSLAGIPWHLTEALRHGPVLLVFFKIACPTCRLTLPFLQRLKERARPGSPQILAVSQDDAPSTAAFLSHFRIDLPAALDKAWDYPASNGFGILIVPSLFLIEPDLTISFSGEGFSKADLEELGERFGAFPFDPGEMVPELRPG